MAFLQARMGSTRLPGKVLMSIHGKSILERSIRRLQAAPDIDEVAVLTTVLPEDLCIAEEACRLGTRVYRGPELDVLRRFQEASEKFRPEIVVRATADNPLIDIGSVGRIIRELRSGHLDLCMETRLPHGAATEACTAAALAKAHALARDFRDREHVTLYIKEHPDEFNVAFPQAPESVRQPTLRVTVDTPEDFNFVSRLIGCLAEGTEPVPLEKYILLALNANDRGSAAVYSRKPEMA